MHKKISGLAPKGRQTPLGFTIIELLIVIVVIAVLATISFVVYRGMTQRAREAVVQQDLDRAHKEIRAHQATEGTLPTADNCPSPTSTEVCLQGSSGTTFTYVPNHPANPTSYQLLATNSGTSYFFDGSSSAKAYGSRIVTLTNLVQNGDFSAGQTGWLHYCNGATQCLFSGGNLTIIADPSGHSRVMQQMAMTSYSDGDRVFYSARARKDSGTDFTMEAHRNLGGHSIMILTAAVFNAAPTGQFMRYSATRNFVASQGDYTTFRAGVSASDRTFQATIDDVVAINLTATFGAGNEPSVAEMEGILSQFENGWFAGTVTATY